MFKKILVAVDGSAPSKRAVELAGELAGRLTAALLILHVVRDMALPPELQEMVRSHEIGKSRLEILQDSGRIILDQAKQQAEKRGARHVRTELREGDPASTIIDYAAEQSVDLIVIGSRGLSQIKGALMGSVSQKVGALSGINCLTVH